jgi:hypothetical protein
LVAPYHLPWGSSVFAIVAVSNIVGQSAFSAPGNDAIILTIPDAPVNLANLPAVTKATKIGVSWANGAENGGSTVLDYQLSYSLETESTYTTISSILTATYTITGLTTGSEYKIRVQSRNEFGLSDYSNEIKVLAAQIPDAPAAPSTAVQDSSVLVDWSAPNEQGSPIIGYQIWIRKSDGTTFAIDSTSCDGADAAVVSSTSCLIPIATLRAGSF